MRCIFIEVDWNCLLIWLYCCCTYVVSVVVFIVFNFRVLLWRKNLSHWKTLRMFWLHSRTHHVMKWNCWGRRQADGRIGPIRSLKSGASLIQRNSSERCMSLSLIAYMYMIDIIMCFVVVLVCLNVEECKIPWSAMNQSPFGFSYLFHLLFQTLKLLTLNAKLFCWIREFILKNSDPIWLRTEHLLCP